MTTRTALLQFLETNPGQWMSGEDISRRLTVSRAAIHKHIKKLRQDGYAIESSTRKGYRINAPHDLITREAIQAGLNTRTLGRHSIVIYPEVDSTNLQAKKLAAQGAPEGTLVVAASQTAGRGRKERTWHSPAGSGLYASLILRPKIPPNEAPAITLMTAVAATEALRALFALPIRIKWPNDLMLNGKKLAGILTEISTDMDSVDYIVVGLGMNVNLKKSELPDEIRKIATSLAMATGKQVARVPVLRSYLNQMESFYSLYLKNGFSEIRSRWKTHSDMIGREVTIEKMEESIRGRIIDIDYEGVLLLEDPAGRIHRMYSGDLIP